ncbi:MAG: CBS domain-containing protein, partial [Thermoplasmata archaeon]|nr:CBS domain-containing protein [Thermoplasmata archaeon]
HLKSPLSVALHILKITRIPALPVIDMRGQLVGIVSDMDVFKILESEKKRRDLRLNVEDDDWTWEGIRNFYQTYAMPGMKLPDLKVENVMVKKVRYLYPRSDVAGAAKAMRVNNIGQLPICGKDDLLIGVLYNYDLLSVLLQGK